MGSRRLSSSDVEGIMSSTTRLRGLNGKNIQAIVMSLALATVVGGLALAAQDRYALKIPHGLAFSELRGYESSPDGAVRQRAASLKVIAANDLMINAYRDGIPDNGKPFPDGSK